MHVKYPFLLNRMDALRDLLHEEKLDGYFLSNLADQVYFTDFKTEGYYGLIGKEGAWLFLPNLLFEHGKAQTRGFTCLEGPFFKTLRKVLSKNKLKKIGFDPNQLPHAFAVPLIKAGFKPVPGLVAKLRAVKDLLEIRRLRDANHLAARGAEYVKKKLLKPGKTEKRVAAELAHFFNLEGDGISFDLIIAGGPNSAFPHHIPGDYILKKNDPVVCDIGGMIEAYHSDLTRTYVMGKISPSFSRIYRIVEKAQIEGIKRLKPGVRADAIDGASRRVIRKAGYGPKFVHSTGHGVGLDIHEDPRIGPKSPMKLEAGMVVTVEPGIYLPGKFGIRIEDTLLVTPSGSEVLTQ